MYIDERRSSYLKTNPLGLEKTCCNFKCFFSKENCILENVQVVVVGPVAGAQAE
jgi:hypothetical protein